MKHRKFPLLTVLLILNVFLIIASVMTGAVRISASDVITSVFSPSSVKGSTAYIVRNIRLPRCLLSFFAGACLACCGLIYQSVFRNPMADSYVLGISSGASCFVALGMLLGIMPSDSAAIPVFAFTGSIITSVLIFALGRKNSFTLLLTGVAFNFFLSACTTLLIYLGKRQLDSILFWTMGSVASAGWPRVIVTAAVTLAVFAFTEKKNLVLDLLLTDDSTAISSGIDIRKSRIILLSVASAVTAIVVAYCGVIGFVGLMCPHFTRLIMGPKHKKLIPCSMLMGSAVLICADIIARLVLAPSEIPIGIVTSLLGAPVFFILLRSRRK